MQKLPDIGESASITLPLTAELVDRFTAYSGDVNPLHHDDAVAQGLGFPGRVVHGMCYASYISTLIGTQLPGDGALWSSQTIRFVAPAFIGDVVTLSGEVTQLSPSARSMTLAVKAVNQEGTLLMDGESSVLLPGAEADAPLAAVVPSAPATKVALVAGATGALGKAIALALSAKGYAVGLGARDEAAADGLQQAIAGEGGIAKAVALDLTNDASVKNAVDAVAQALGPVSLVVHCASPSLPATPAAETTWSAFSQHHDVQVGGLLRLYQAIGPEMAARRDGQFILISTTATRGTPPKNMAPYVAAKAGAVALAKSMALELGPSGVRTNIVSPHFIAAGLNASTQAKAQKLAAATTPLRRLAEESEVAASVAFLASDEAAFVNGNDLFIDGGAVMS